MPIRDLIYRCPSCNSEVIGIGPDKVVCAKCQTMFSRSAHAQILVEPTEKKPYLTSASSLMRSIEAYVHSRNQSLVGDEYALSSLATIHKVEEYEVVYHNGEVLGYTEIVREHTSGLLQLGRMLVFSVDENTLYNWYLEQVRCFLVSSKSIQIYIKRQGLFQFELADASPKEWEDSLTRAVESFYATKGQEVFTYRPVIKTRTLKS